VSRPQYHIERALLELEVDIETYRGSGPGGQHRNVTESAVRLVHRPSGVRVTASESRSQHRNREVAFIRLIERLKQLNRVQAPRVPMRKPKAATERRLNAKRRRQTAKGLRRPVKDADQE
jgi:ribosome-associated protein